MCFLIALSPLIVYSRIEREGFLFWFFFSTLPCAEIRFLTIVTVLLFRKEGNVLFYDADNTFYLRLYGVKHMVNVYSVRAETRCCHIGYSILLAARVILYASSHRQIPRPLLHQSWSTDWNEKYCHLDSMLVAPWTH